MNSFPPHSLHNLFIVLIYISVCHQRSSETVVSHLNNLRNIRSLIRYIYEYISYI